MKKLVELALASGLAFSAVCGFASGASAQARGAVAASGAQALSTPPAPLLGASQQRDDVKKRDKNPMGVAGVGLKVGVAGMGEGKLSISRDGETYRSSVEARRGLQVSLPIDVGGDGFGWRFEPYLSFASVGVSRTTSAGVQPGEQANLNAYGMYTGPTVNLHVMQPLYVGIGAGLKAAYVHSDAFDLALDAYLRAPITATYYMTNTVALVAEVGFGYGASVYFNQPEKVVDPVTRVVSNENQDPQAGRAFLWDCSVGVRLP
ncbi:MAG TPA: hypothetical protein VFX59_02900 [Polyangiales bacterium]|nr:hypothetical protein [Polyangiales bacterium]